MSEKIVEHNIVGFHVTSHFLDVPLDWGNPGGEQIEIHARVVANTDNEAKPYLVFLQGGPGNEAPRATLEPLNPSWLQVALRDYRVVLLDQRGTGLSTELKGVTAWPLERQVSYLTKLRADAIVRDCEAVREYLGVKKWSVLGQSFGGFTTLAYLSTNAQSLNEAILTGGLSAVGRHCDDVYSATYKIMERKTLAHYKRFPQDRSRMHDLAQLAVDGRLLTINGDTVSLENLRTIGICLGRGGGSEALHYFLELDPQGPAFQADLTAMLAFHARNPIYSVLHESSYADGCVTNWSAMRVQPDSYRNDPTLLTGEHVHPSVISDSSFLAPYAPVAQALAQHQWNKIYDKNVLSQIDFPVAASVYIDDAFVPYEFSLETASLIPSIKTWQTNEYEHNGLRADNRVLARLIDLVKNRA